MEQIALKFTPFRIITTLILSTILAGCGGGSGGGTTPTPTPTPTTTPTPPPSGRYLFYQSGTDGPLMAVDPGTPTTPQQVSLGPISSKALDAIGHGTFDVAVNAYTVYDLHTRTIIYAEDGKLWKVGAFKADSLVKTQVSSETAATNICQTVTATDLNNHDNAAYVYELAGSDNVCTTTGDNLWRMVRLGMDSTTAPISARQPLTSIDESTTGKAIGWLVNEGGHLKCYSADFSSSENVIGAPTGYSSISYYAPINISQEIIRIDGAIGTYTTETNTWKSQATAFSTYVDTHSVRENGYLYYADLYTNPSPPNTPILIIFRNQLITESGSTPIFQISGFDTASDQLSLKSTSSKLILGIYQGGTPQSQINSINKTDGSNQTVLTGTTFPGNIRSLITNGDRLYYSYDQGTAYLTDGTKENFTTTSPPSPNLSGSTFTSSTSAWLGAIQSDQYVIGNTPQPKTLFLAEGFSDSTNGFAGGFLTRYDAAIATRGDVVGTIPADIKEVHIEGNRTITLAKGTRIDDATNEIFFVDVDTPNSLIRVTTDNVNDIIIDAYH